MTILLSVDGTALDTTWRTVETASGIYGGGQPTGDLPRIVSLPGRSWRPRTQDSVPVALGIAVHGDSAAELEERITTTVDLLRAAGSPAVDDTAGPPVQLQRQRTLTSGTETVESPVTMAEPPTVARLGELDARISVELERLDPEWWETSSTTSSLTTTLTTVAVAGDIITRRILVTVDDDAFLTLTNNTTGHELSFGGTGAGTGSIELDAYNRDVTFGFASEVTWRTSDTNWFALAPGNNELEISSTSYSVTVEHHGAYL